MNVFVRVSILLPVVLSYSVAAHAQKPPQSGAHVFEVVRTFLDSQKASPNELQEKFSPEVLAFLEHDFLGKMSLLPPPQTDGSVKAFSAPAVSGVVFTEEALIGALNDALGDTGYVLERVVFPADSEAGQAAAMMGLGTGKSGLYSTSDISPGQTLSVNLPGESWYVRLLEFSAAGMMPAVTGERWEIYILNFAWWEPE